MQKRIKFVYEYSFFPYSEYNSTSSDFVATDADATAVLHTLGCDYVDIICVHWCVRML